MISTELLQPTPDGIARAADLIRCGKLVAFPTETVYGLGADATNDDAVARIYSAKNRPLRNPLIVHVATLAEAETFAVFSEAARRLAQAFWPGPLTLVLPARSDTRLSKLLSAGSDHIAIRIPSAPIATSLLASVGRPIAAPSANPSGRVSPTYAAHVLTGLAGRIDAILDGGPCAVGVESTIVAFAPQPKILRPGGITPDDLEAVLGQPVTRPGAQATDLPASPGQDLSHYAPRVPVRLNAAAAEDGEVLLGFGAVEADENLSPTGDLDEAASNLFLLLHALDSLGRPIAVSPVPEVGVGLAINDRLRRAAAPRNP